jgi:hypothetical protein
MRRLARQGDHTRDGTSPYVVTAAVAVTCSTDRQAGVSGRGAQGVLALLADLACPAL